MKKIKLFIENFVIYGIGGVIGKLIPLIMIPIIARILPDSAYFGVNDNTTALVSIATYISLMGMYDAMYRFFFEKEDLEYRKKICSTTFAYTFLISFFVASLMWVYNKSLAKLFLGDSNYGYVVIVAAFTTLVSATNTIVSGPARMQNKRVIYVVMNSIVPLISYILALLMMLQGFYVIALPLAIFISGLINELVFIIYNRSWFRFRFIDMKLLLPLLKFAVPLIPNFLIYWIFNSCDRLMITHLLGIGAAGVYGIGSKLGAASQLIYTAFAGGWQYFAYSTMSDNNQVKDNSKLFEYLGLVTILSTAFLCIISYGLYHLLFEKEYLEGYLIAPYLFMAPLCQMLFQVAVSQFAIIKKTWTNMFFLSVGAVANVFLNLYLIPKMGIEGAAVATLVGYIISVATCVGVLEHVKLFAIRLKFLGALFGGGAFFILWRVLFNKNMVGSICLGLALFLYIIILYKEDISLFWVSVHKIKKGK